MANLLWDVAIGFMRRDRVAESIQAIGSLSELFDRSVQSGNPHNPRGGRFSCRFDREHGTDHVRLPNWTGATLWSAKYSFSTPDEPGRIYAGPTRRAEKDMFFSKPTIGSEVQVRYIPDDPAHNAISTTEPLRWKAYFVIGVGIIALWGALLAYRDVRAYRRW